MAGGDGFGAVARWGAGDFQAGGEGVDEVGAGGGDVLGDRHLGPAVDDFEPTDEVEGFELAVGVGSREVDCSQFRAGRQALELAGGAVRSGAGEAGDPVGVENDEGGLGGDLLGACGERRVDTVAVEVSGLDVVQMAELREFAGRANLAADDASNPAFRLSCVRPVCACGKRRPWTLRRLAKSQCRLPSRAPRWQPLAGERLNTKPTPARAALRLRRAISAPNGFALPVGSSASGVAPRKAWFPTTSQPATC